MSKSEKEGEPSPQLEEDHYGRPRDGDRQKSRKDNDPHDTSGPILNGDERMGSSRSPPSRRYDEERGVQRPRSNTPEETGDLRERRRPSRSRSRDRRDRRQKHKSRDHRENRSRSRSHSSGRSRSRSSRRRRERDDDHENRKHSHRHGSSSSRRKVGDRRVPQFGGERDRLDGDGVPYASLGGGPGRYGGGGPPPHVGSGGMRGAGYVDDGYYGRGGGPPGPQGPYGGRLIILFIYRTRYFLNASYRLFRTLSWRSTRWIRSIWSTSTWISRRRSTSSLGGRAPRRTATNAGRGQGS